MTEELERLRAKLADMLRNQEWAAMGDDFYYTNGRKEAADREINEVRREIAALEKAGGA